jgi:hypothetical protein
VARITSGIGVKPNTLKCPISAVTNFFSFLHALNAMNCAVGHIFSSMIGSTKNDR